MALRAIARAGEARGVARPRRLTLLSSHRGSMSNLTEKIKEEALALLPPTVFFLFVLSLAAV
jgi:hypothetical protein